MKVKKAVTKKDTTTKPKNYLTTRILDAAAKKGFQEAAEETAQVMGYNVIVENGNVIKKYNGGIKEVIGKVKKSSLNGKKLLD